MTAKIYYPTLINANQKTLDAQLLSGATASMTLNNVTNIQNKAGVCVIDAVDTNGAYTPAKREYIAFTGVSGSTLTGLTRNADGGGSDQDHAVGAIVQFGPDIVQQQGLIDFVGVQHNLADGVHTNALVTSLKATGAVVNTGTSDVTIVTPKAIADSNISFPTKTETLTNKTLTSPKINEDVALTATATQLNAQVLASNDGWTSANETWTYASASTITVPSGAAAKYVKGDRIMWTQTTLKVGVIVAVADTLLTIAVNTNYTFANAVISANYYSHELSPINYSGTFAWTPTWGGFTATVPTGTFFYSIVKNIITVFYASGTPGTSNATTFTFTLPLAPSTSFPGIPCFVADAGVNGSTPGQIQLIAASATASVYKTFYQGAFTNSGGKDFYINSFSYAY